MNRFQATSRCECQALLSAILNDKRHVLEGSATRLGVRETAPAHAIGASRDPFDIGWMCPFCGRNTLRTFHPGALLKLAEPEPATDSAAAPAAKSP